MSEEQKKEISPEDKDWLTACLLVVPVLYCSIPIRTFHLLVGLNSEMDEEQMKKEMRALPDELNPCVISGLQIVAKDFYYSAAYIKVEAEQGQRPYYIPTEEEIREIAGEGWIYSQKECQDMIRFLKKTLDLETEEAYALTSILWQRLSMSATRSQIDQLLAEQGITFETEGEDNQFEDLLQALHMHTRRIVDRGYTLSQLEMRTPRDLTNPEKKIYPNDPCPCGSGKKYKYCHGRLLYEWGVDPSQEKKERMTDRKNNRL